MKKNYPYAYNNLKREHQVIIERLNSISNSEYLTQLASLKEKVTEFTLLEEFDVQDCYTNLKNMYNILEEEVPALDNLTHSLYLSGELNEEIMSLRVTGKLISRYQMDLHSFLRNMRLDFLDTITEDVNSQDILGETLLMYAMLKPEQEIINRLLEKGANPFQEDNYGNSAFSIALRKSNEEIARKFINHKLDKTQLDELETKIQEDSEGFFHFIAANICSKHSNLHQQLGLDEDGALRCFDEAKTVHAIIGGDIEDLSCGFI